MRLRRVTDGARVVLARVEGERGVVVATESAHPAADVVREVLHAGAALDGPGEEIELAGWRTLAPVANPSKIVAIGLNYADHAAEAGMERPSSPISFAKAPSAIVGPDEPIAWSAAASGQVDFEAELAVVIGQRARALPTGRGLEAVLGYTCCNDVSARDAQFADGQWWRGKSFDTFMPMGPDIVTGDEIPDVQSLPIRCLVNGKRYQDALTSDMLFPVSELVEYLSRFMTLEPGDVIATGTPPGVGFSRTPPVFLTDGAVVQVEIDGVGRLANSIRVAV